MTTTQKLWLGFVTLTMVLLLSCAVILVRVWHIEEAIGEMAESAQPRGATTIEFEAYNARRDATLHDLRSIADTVAVLFIVCLVFAAAASWAIGRGAVKAGLKVQAARTYAEGIVETVREPLIILDGDLCVQSANRSFCDTFHVTLKETTHRHIYELGNRQWDIPALRTLLEEVLPQKTAINDYEVGHNFPGLGRRIMLLNARRIAHGPNAAPLILLAMEDITERKRLEQHLQDALTYAENVIATMREPFVVLDKSLTVQSANRSFYRTFHVSRPETEGRFLYELGDGQWNSPDLRALLAGVLPNQKPIHNFNVDRVFPVIGKRTMLLNASPFESVNSQPSMILVAIEDITERELEQVAVHTSEARYRRLFETAKDGIVILDADTGKILDANPFMTELLGYTQAEFIGKELWEIGLFSDKSGNEAAFHDLQKHGYVRYDHLPLSTSGGKKAEVEFISNVYRVGQRHVAQCNIRDISERSRLERLNNVQKAELSDLHRRKDEFLAMLGHELRNPLAPIMNAVQLLRLLGGQSGPQEQARAIIERQVGQLVHLVDDLLEVSRIATGRIHLQQKQLDFRAIVECGIETVRPLIQQRRHTLDIRLPPSPAWINGDSTRLEQVVVNLLNNAAKYTDEGGHIWLSLQSEGYETVLQIRDSGVGIAPELMPHIFDLFTQAERSLARSQGGLGIGLCLVQRLVEMHGGTVTAQSTLGQGSEFAVRLPVMPIAAPAPPLALETAQPTANRLRVLVVDDNVDTADTLAMLLVAAGHEVRTAHDGPQALASAVEFRPNVMLLDIGLPGLDGFEVAKRIRKIPELQHIVLAAMTGYGQETDRQRSQEAGFDHHLVKPARFELVQIIMASVLSKSKIQESDDRSHRTEVRGQETGDRSQASMV